MSDSLSIQPAASQGASAVQAAVQPTTATATGTGNTAKVLLPAMPNPSMHLDPQLGVMVLEFHSASGQVTNTLPTQQQLDAYRAFGAPGSDKARTLA